MKKILVAISGGISAYKAADVISGLKSNNFEVRVITTKSALDFITPTVIGAISGGNYITDNDVNRIAHIDEAQNCDAFICVPATANIIAKFTHGIADDFVTSTFAAIPDNIPKVICPAMNTKMYENITNQSNMSYLESTMHCKIIDPVKGLLACGDIGIGKLPKSRKIVEVIVEMLDERIPWEWPVQQDPIGSSNDSYSYLHINQVQEVEIPLYPHVGAFGAKRRHDRHRGVDLYVMEGIKVLAVEDGTVQDIRPWTGKIANCDWWEDTWAILIEGESGLVVYGEIEIDPEIKKTYDELRRARYKIGVKRGQVIGEVVRVLKKDKGRPRTMLHLELREPGFYKNIDKSWEGNTMPKGIKDPTPYLQRSIKHFAIPWEDTQQK